ncbi:hypothetical protein P261_00909 [Lachnospiraceae bacterium TWA4]|nr:hypothetical protein P261_00909 [Lachnospiraceae bacterium TWA4]
MRKWVKPELVEEEFELDQHVAAGCGTKTEIIVTPGGSISVGYGCHSSYPGGGHWHTTAIIPDKNKNGKIDWSEVVDALKTADNGVRTGNGHRNHQASITYKDIEYWKDEQQPFTS